MNITLEPLIPVPQRRDSVMFNGRRIGTIEPSAIPGQLLAALDRLVGDSCLNNSPRLPIAHGANAQEAIENAVKLAHADAVDYLKRVEAAAKEMGIEIPTHLLPF